MKPDLLVPLEEFRGDMTAMIERIKVTPRPAGVEEIRIPSERAFRERGANRSKGIDIDRHVYDQLAALARTRRV
jgi:LDH2 family malate/lactate/ureidoglycolate dehydrogenase